jgi:hypothetical protein
MGGTIGVTNGIIEMDPGLLARRASRFEADQPVADELTALSARP